MSMMEQSLRETYNTIPSVGVLNVLGVNALHASSENLRIYNIRVDTVSQIFITTMYKRFGHLTDCLRYNSNNSVGFERTNVAPLQCMKSLLFD